MANWRGGLPPTFAEAGPILERYGYAPIPVKPGGKRPGFSGWQMGGSVVELMPGRETWGIGLLAARTPGLDLDVRDPNLVRELYHLAVATLGEAPVRIGERPKALLPYRTTVPFAKMAAEYVLLTDDTAAPDFKPHKIELLAAGQQYCCFHVHPGTGRPYAWYRGSPLSIPAAELSPITAESARAYLTAADGLLVTRGARVLKTAEQGGKPPTPLRPTVERGGLPPRQIETRDEAERIADALRYIPVDGLSYSDWVRVGLALKGALGEAGLPLWTWWSAQHPDNRLEDSERKWKSFRPSRIGIGTLYHLEKTLGRG